MSTYLIDTPIKGETNIAGWGTLSFDYPAGPCVPTDAENEVILAFLASVGLVKETKDSPTASRKAKSAVNAENLEE